MNRARLALLVACATVVGTDAAAAWQVGGASRLVVIDAELRQAGLEPTPFLAGVAASHTARRFTVDATWLDGGGRQRLDLSGVDDPRLRTRALSASVRWHPSGSPWFVAAGVGLWRFDYLDQRRTLPIEGVGDIELVFDDFTAPQLLGGTGVSTPRSGRWRARAQVDWLGLHLGSAEIDGASARVARRWFWQPSLLVIGAFAF